MTEKADLYHGGFAGLLRRQEKRQRRFLALDDALPAADIDLTPLFTRLTAPPTTHFEDADRYTARRKWLELQQEFQGQPEILHLHAMLIAVSRRDDPPANAVTLFHRIWAEHGSQMVALLNVRWMISAATSFSDIGQTGDQRACGMALSILFDMMKLHDSERRISGQPGRTPFRAGSDRKPLPLPFGMEPYAFVGGDLDKIMLARIWQLCERDATIRPLGMAMLFMVMGDPRSIFGRVQELKKQRKKG
tara:strand:- start:14984 stop:15727 length:744 start_codon:yes stop_codon:yes gene_type:complete